LAIAIAALSIAMDVQLAHAANRDATLFGHNLVVNGNAEANVGSDDETVVVKPSGWTTSGQFGVFKYGGIFGFPDRSVPGPNDRGKNFFTGGDAPVSKATQLVDLRSIAAAIDAGDVRFNLSAWLGGYDAQDDYATVSAVFLNSLAHTLGQVRLGPVTPADRGAHTSLVARSLAGTVPKRTRTVRVVLTANRVVGTSDDGYIDDVSLVLTRKS
jgi:hypothetical protein